MGAQNKRNYVDKELNRHGNAYRTIHRLLCGYKDTEISSSRADQRRLYLVVLGIVDVHQEVETDAKIQKQEIARGHVEGRKRKALVEHRVCQGK